MKVKAVQCPECEDIIYSRAVHDFHYCSCGYVFIDGGFEYIRYGSKEIDRIKSTEIEVDATRQELFDDWNNQIDKFGIKHTKIITSASCKKRSRKGRKNDN